MPPQGNHPDEHRPSTAPKLLIRTTLTDDGTRNLLPGTVYYYSPDIGRSPADPLSLIVDPLGKVQVGQPVKLAATVQNLSALGHAYGTTATFSWAKPSLGALTDIKQIGVSTPKVTIGAGQARVLECPTHWVPELVGGSHPCLLVHVQCMLDKPDYPNQPMLDRRVAQRNVTELQAGSEATLPLVVNNPLPVQATASITVHSWRITGVDRLVGGDLSAAPADLLAHAGDSLVAERLRRYGVEIERIEALGLHVSDVFDLTEFPGFDERTQQQLRMRRGERGGTQTVKEFNLPPRVQGQVTVHFDAGPADGAAYVHHLTQAIDGLEIGGYTVTTSAD